MNTRLVIENSSDRVALSASFNQDASCFSVGLENGFSVFSTEPCQLRTFRDFKAGIGAAVMIRKSNYLALVGGGREPKHPQNQVIIWDDSQQKISSLITVPGTVRNVKFAGNHICIVLHSEIRIYPFKSQPPLLAAHETPSNPEGLCCMTDKIVVFPGPRAGQVKVLNLETGSITLILAHTTRLKALDLSRDGMLLATASEKGTLIRVFSTLSSAPVAELRRGVDYVSIFSISFSPSNLLLAVTSDKSTLHVFDVPRSQKAEQPEPVSKWGALGRLPFAPRIFTDVGSFASIKFTLGQDYRASEGQVQGPTIYSGDSGIRPPQGIIGWISNETIVILGCGSDARWEKFVIAPDFDDRRSLQKKGWKKYLGDEMF